MGHHTDSIADCDQAASEARQAETEIGVHKRRRVSGAGTSTAEDMQLMHMCRRISRDLLAKSQERSMPSETRGSGTAIQLRRKLPLTGRPPRNSIHALSGEKEIQLLPRKDGCLARPAGGGCTWLVRHTLADECLRFTVDVPVSRAAGVFTPGQPDDNRLTVAYLASSVPKPGIEAERLKPCEIFRESAMQSSKMEELSPGNFEKSSIPAFKLLA
jgi:hypothetical protein